MEKENLINTCVSEKLLNYFLSSLIISNVFFFFLYSPFDL